MEYLPIAILIILIVLLLAAAFLWTSGTSLLPDPELSHLREILEKISHSYGYNESLTVRRGKSFYTKDRKIIYLNLKGYNIEGKDGKKKKDKYIIRRNMHELAHYIKEKKDKENNEYIIRRSIHELAHCINRDASEHGGIYQQIEDRLVSHAKELSILSSSSDYEIKDCLTVLKEDDSEERAHHDRMNYSMLFDPKTIY